MLTHDNIRVLLVQLRDDPLMQLHEQKAVSRSGKVSADQIDTINGIKQTISANDLAGYHMLIIGGTGDYSIFDDLPATQTLPDVLRYAKDTNFPTLGSCWGGQYMAQLFGGQVMTDPGREEVGSVIISPTPHALNDPVFSGAPKQFWAQVGHHESIVKLPDGAATLLSSEKCEIEAFTWPGSALYGLQIHSDLSRGELEERVTHYRDSYAASQEEFDRFLASLEDSPYTDNLIEKFIRSIALPRWNKT